MSASPIVFLDPACPRPYSAATLREEALGGTEGTVVRVAEALGALVAQHNRSEGEGRYRSLREVAASATDREAAEHVVVIREPQALASAEELYPRARKYLWLHDLVRPGSKRGRRVVEHGALLHRSRATVICVSEFQRCAVAATLAGVSGGQHIATRVIHNPIDDSLAPDGSDVDPLRLVFFSSPDKRLRFTLDAFRAVRRRWPEVRLLIGNPGYRSGRAAQEPGVAWLGPLPHARMLDVVRGAFCVFYPNFVVPETFGLVFAEANAVGTPVLTHDCGAAGEVLRDPRQVLPVRRSQRVYERLARAAPDGWREVTLVAGRWAGVFDPYLDCLQDWWSHGRPRVRADPHFRVSSIAAQWRAMFAGG